MRVPSFLKGEAGHSHALDTVQTENRTLKEIYTASRS